MLETFSTRPIWWHFLCISVPNKLTRPNAAFMLIDGGGNDGNSYMNSYLLKLKYIVFFV